MAEINRSTLTTEDALKVPYEYKEGFDAAGESLENYVKQLDVLITKSIQMEKTIKGGTSTEKVKKETENLTLAQQELLKIQKQIAVSQAKNNDEYRDATKTLDGVKKQLKEKQALGERDAKTVNAQNASVKELGAALIKNRAAYESLATAEHRNSAEGKELLKVIQSQDTELKELKKSVGQNQLEVGNYEGAVKKLKDELRKAQDEMAGIAQKLGADSQEFREASERAGGLKNELNDLQESVKIVSGNKFENLGATLGLVGSKLKTLDFKGAAAAAKQLNAVTKSITFKELTEGIGDFGKTIGAVGKSLLVNPIFLIATAILGTIAALKALKDFSPIISKAFDLVGDAVGFVIQQLKDLSDFIGLTNFALVEQTELIIENSKKRIAAIQTAADQEIRIAQAAGKETLDLEIKKNRAVIAESTKALQKLYETQKEFNGKLNEDQQAAWDENVAIIAEANTEIQALEAAHQKELADKAKERLLREQGDAFKLQQFLIQQEIEKQKRLAENEQLGVDDRIRASEEIDRQRRKLAFLETEFALTQEDLTASGRKMIYAKLQQDLNDITREGVEQRNDITKDEFDADKARIEKRILAQKKAIQTELELKGRALDEEIQAIQKAVIDGNLTRVEGDKEISKAKKAFLDDQVNNEIEAVKSILAIENLATEEKEELTKRLYKLQKDLTAAYYEQVEEGQKSWLERLAETLEKVQGLYQDFASGISGLFNSLSERRLQKIDEESAANQKALDEQLDKEELATKTRLANEQLSDEQRAQIEAAADVRKKELEEAAERREQELEARRRKEARKTAILNKALALGEAVINTALAATKAASQTGIGAVAAVPIVLALGALQIAAIAARPIPAAKHGTKSHEGGPILVGEEGHELLYKPSGAVGITPNLPTIMNLEKGTEVVPHRETMRRLAMSGLRASDFDRRGTKDDSLLKGLKRVEKAIVNKREWHLKGQVTGYQESGSHINYINQSRNR